LTIGPKLKRIRKLRSLKRRFLSQNIMIGPITRFVQNAFNELNNVTWPTRTQAIHSMATVLSIMFIVAGLLVFIDYVLNLVILDFLRGTIAP